jgi:hypothetical protein
VLHVAARFNQPGVLRQLLSVDSAQSGGLAQAAVQKNRDSFTPLALAAYHGAAAAAGELLAAHAAAAGVADKHGYTPTQLAQRRGFKALAGQLQQGGPAGPAGGDRSRTLVVAPPECQLHFTCPDPLPRGMSPPPENVDRLRVLVDEGKGILRGSRLAALLDWELSVQPAPMSDVLRVHDWNYVRGLQVRWAACARMPAAQPQRAGCQGRARGCAISRPG